eukprot:CAMPEP_0177790248 /NCGR_PEP_ID=MMETSP0491_2-20121128/23233_1 /TAXON_ID=63592 /ORGANISM="Tetraselmis chuii, Strain PLY429" /LENGTH=149 /DNA_ID=CAMNT_0019312269 /DNA_START=1240 /DNA_END=1686 /DNA_ORIENTATION=+
MFATEAVQPCTLHIGSFLSFRGRLVFFSAVLALLESGSCCVVVSALRRCREALRAFRRAPKSRFPPAYCSILTVPRYRPLVFFHAVLAFAASRLILHSRQTYARRPACMTSPLTLAAGLIKNDSRLPLTAGAVSRDGGGERPKVLAVYS